jgi:hypothetical protein
VPEPKDEWGFAGYNSLRFRNKGDAALFKLFL